MNLCRPVTRTTEDDDLIWRFLSAASARAMLDEGPGHRKLSPLYATVTIDWLRTLVGNLNDDGSTGNAAR